VSVRIILIYFLLAFSLTAQENKISIAFEDIPELLKQFSPEYKTINARLDMVKADRDLALQWSNPELNYSKEQSNGRSEKENEQLAFLSKTFDLPWNYWQERKIWDAELNAANLHMSQNVNQLLADARIGYVQIGLLQNLNMNLTNVAEVLNDLNQTINARQEEGAISQLDATLLSMGLFGLEADILEIQQTQSREFGKWKRLIGLDTFQEVKLTALIDFKKVVNNLSENQSILENNPGLNAKQIQLDVLESRVSLEKSRILPSLSLQGGLKKTNQNWQGYILGLSFPLPILNWSSAQIEKQKLESRIQVNATHAYKQKIQSDLNNLINTINVGSALIQKNNFRGHSFEIADNLFAAYKEGALSLPEFLSSIQIYREGSRQYTKLLIEYYRAVFELEALSGKQLVTF